MGLQIDKFNKFLKEKNINEEEFWNRPKISESLYLRNLQKFQMKIFST